MSLTRGLPPFFTYLALLSARIPIKTSGGFSAINTVAVVAISPQRGSCNSLFAHRDTVELQSLTESCGKAWQLSKPKAFQESRNDVTVCRSWLGIPAKPHSTWAGLLKHHEKQTWNTSTPKALAANNHQKTPVAFKRSHTTPDFPCLLSSMSALKRLATGMHFILSLFANIRFWTRPHHMLGLPPPSFFFPYQNPKPSPRRFLGSVSLAQLKVFNTRVTRH